MSKKDVPYYLGLMLGIAAGATAMRVLGVQHQLLQLGAGLVVGVGLGYFADKCFGRGSEEE